MRQAFVIVLPVLKLCGCGSSSSSSEMITTTWKEEERLEKREEGSEVRCTVHEARELEVRWGGGGGGRHYCVALGARIRKARQGGEGAYVVIVRTVLWGRRRRLGGGEAMQAISTGQERAQGKGGGLQMKRKRQGGDGVEDYNNNNADAFEVGGTQGRGGSCLLTLAAAEPDPLRPPTSESGIRGTAAETNAVAAWELPAEV